MAIPKIVQSGKKKIEEERKKREITTEQVAGGTLVSRQSPTDPTKTREVFLRGEETQKPEVQQVQTAPVQGDLGDFEFLLQTGAITETGETPSQFNSATLTDEQRNALQRIQDAQRAAELQAQEEQLVKQEETAKEQDAQESIDIAFQQLEEDRRTAERIKQGDIAATGTAASFEPGTLEATARTGAALGQLEGIKVRSAEQQRKFQQIASSIRSSQRRLETARQAGDIEEEKKALRERALADIRAKELEAESKRLGQEESQKTLDFFDKLSSSAIAALSDDDILKLEEDFEAAGRPISVLSAIRSKATQLAKAEEELAKDPKNVEKFNKVQALKGTIDKIKFEAGESELDKEITGFTNSINALVASGDITQERADELIQARLDKEAGIERTKTEVAETELNETGSIQPTGEIETDTFAGRSVTLDSGAMGAFRLANKAALEELGAEIKVGGESTSSLRDQTATIAGMVSDWNRKNPQDILEFDKSAPNNSAAALRQRGVQVANVGASKHENGLALDIFPDKDYISKVKPILEKNGWKQVLPFKDPGHFEFMGLDAQVEVKDQLMPLYAKWNQGDKSLTAEEWKTIETTTTRDEFIKEAKEAKKETDKRGAEFAREVISLAEDLIVPSKKGVSMATLLPGGTLFDEKTGAAFGLGVIPGTKFADYRANFDAFQSKLGLNELTTQKAAGATFGALSNQELNFLTNAATSLRLSMTDEAFNRELNRIIVKLQKALPEYEEQDKDPLGIINDPLGIL